MAWEAAAVGRHESTATDTACSHVDGAPGASRTPGAGRPHPWCASHEMLDGDSPAALAWALLTAPCCRLAKVNDIVLH